MHNFYLILCFSFFVLATSRQRKLLRAAYNCKVSSKKKKGNKLTDIHQKVLSFFARLPSTKKYHLKNNSQHDAARRQRILMSYFYFYISHLFKILVERFLFNHMVLHTQKNYSSEGWGLSEKTTMSAVGHNEARH